VQHAIADFMREGHYMRHLRRMKRIYAERGELVRATLEGLGYEVRIGGLGVLLRLPDGAPDVAMAQEARGLGLGPEPLSRWFDPQSQADRGLLLGVATADETRIPDACRTLHDLIAKHL
jgi:GntR family transcriptional regulator/MocR family aminotransferase